MKQNCKKDTVVGVLKNKSDLPIVINDKWYRIPVKSAPIIVRDKTIKHIAFYQGGKFKDSQSQIQYFSEVKKISVHKRIELLPNEKNNPNADNDYYKIELAEVIKLENPIIAIRPRRINFIITDFRRFIKANDLNEVFCGSYIEEKVWNALKSERIDAEREFEIYYQAGDRDKFFRLDFALFCKNRNIDLECNGDKYHHENKEDVKKDKRRDRILTQKGWAAYRFTRDEINMKLGESINELKKTIDYYGGLQDKYNTNRYKFISNAKQLPLFPEMYHTDIK